MSEMVADRVPAAHRVNGEIPRRMAKADLPKGENAPQREEWRAIGSCLDEARRFVGWTVDRLAQELGDGVKPRDSKQVARWIRGDERPQVDVIFGVRALRQPFVIALAKLADCEIQTVVTIRRTA